MMFFSSEINFKDESPEEKNIMSHREMYEDIMSN